jgi:hypothetical protein
MTPDRAQRETRNRFDMGVIVAIIALSISTLGAMLKGGQIAGDFNARLQGIERRLDTAPPAVEITPGAAREIASLKARQDADDRHWIEWDARLQRIEQTQSQILTELRRR